MKIGLIADVHGNSVALRAVIHDAAACGVTHWWALGDLVALGPDPVGVIELLNGLDELQAIGGNTERYVLRGERPFPSFDDAAQDPALIPRLVEVATSFAWTRGAITQAGWLPWLDRLPSQLRITLPDGTRVLGVHASPSSDDGDGIDSRISDAALGELLDGCQADVVFGGHTHDMTDRTVGQVRAVNLGSVANSSRADRCATYAILHIERTSHSIEQRVVPFDRSAALQAIDEARHPAPDYLRRFLT
ncbi:MAG: metallophosphoesterase family protein [Ilumatobacteraceae bacterium]